VCVPTKAEAKLAERNGYVRYAKSYRKGAGWRSY